MDPFALIFWVVVIAMGIGVKLLILYWIYLALCKVGSAIKALCIGILDAFQKPRTVHIVHHFHTRT